VTPCDTLTGQGVTILSQSNQRLLEGVTGVTPYI
jgi:hypothetical protein